MGVGSKIKELRTREGLTQKDLADKLNVTYQAVSRWENEETEPSFDTIRDMCNIFNCSTDELFGIERKDDEEKVKVVERVIVQEQKPVLAVCEECNKPMYDADEIQRVSYMVRIRNGRSSHTEERKKVLCKDCNEKRLAQIQEAKEKKRQEKLAQLKTRRIHSIVWPSIALALFVVLGIIDITKENTSTGIFLIVIGVLAYTTIATMILNNTFLTDLWEEIASWGFVRFPGIIFDFSLEGLGFLIVVKLLFVVIGFVIGLLAVILATAIAAVLSIFVYPFALSRNIRGIVN